MPGQTHLFVDEAVILARSGRGGDGCMSFRREKYEPRGGPDGGNGGKGGNVILLADPQLATLLDIGRSRIYTAEKGQPGRGKNQFGRNGEHRVVRVPVGTLVREPKTGELLHDLVEPGQEVIVARGGRGGRGNKTFATSTHQAPREREKGGEEEERELALELRLMAEVGLLGLPNAGKSTLLARVSAARPRIASYPFTTLTPQLGIAELDLERRLVIADIPGLIAGAHQGVGLGLGFLRHLQRTHVLIHLIDAHERTDEELVHDFRVIREELARYSAELASRPIVTVLSKIDLLTEEERRGRIRRLSEATGEPVLGISGATGMGTREVLDEAWRRVHP